MRVTVLLAIALTIAFAMAASAESRQAVSTIPPITDPIRGVGTAALPGAPHGVSTDQGFGALTGKPGSPIFDPLAQALGSSSTALLEVELQRLMRTW
jgi:hypothetical protein